MSKMRHLRYWRRARGLTQQELAAALGVSVQAVGCWERGTREPYARHIKATCRLLKVTPEALMGAPDVADHAALDVAS